jgi:hypothetical protein
VCILYGPTHTIHTSQSKLQSKLQHRSKQNTESHSTFFLCSLLLFYIYTHSTRTFFLFFCFFCFCFWFSSLSLSSTLCLMKRFVFSLHFSMSHITHPFFHSLAVFCVGSVAVCVVCLHTQFLVEYSRATYVEYCSGDDRDC